MSESERKQSRLRKICYTINNYKDADMEKMNAMRDEHCNYMCYSFEEAPTTGTPHIQGYCEFKKQLGWFKVKSFNKRMSFRAAYGNLKSQHRYVTKHGTQEMIEWGTPKKQGNRTDLKVMYDMIKEGKSDVDLAEANVGMYLRYYKGFDRLRFNLAKEDKKFTPMRNCVIIGPKGIGKSRIAREIDPNLYQLPSLSRGLWFDGYSGEKTILLEDYRGQLDVSDLLHLMDGYRYMVPCKGGHVWKQWTQVIITSNTLVENWHGEREAPNILRRVGLSSITRPTSEQPTESPNEMLNVPLDELLSKFRTSEHPAIGTT